MYIPFLSICIDGMYYIILLFNHCFGRLLSSVIIHYGSLQKMQVTNRLHILFH